MYLNLTRILLPQSMQGKDLEGSRFGVNAWRERESLEGVTVRGEEEDDRWGTKGYKYPQIWNYNGQIQKSEPPRKSSEPLNFEKDANWSLYCRNLREINWCLRKQEQLSNSSS